MRDEFDPIFHVPNVYLGELTGMNRQEWANITVAEGSGIDALQLESGQIISKLGRAAKSQGLLVVPSATNKQVIVHKDSVNGFLQLCASKGLVGRIVGDFVSQAPRSTEDAESQVAEERTPVGDVIAEFFEEAILGPGRPGAMPSPGDKIDWDTRLGLADAVKGAKTREAMMEALNKLQLRAPVASAVPVHGDIGIAKDGSLKLDESESRKRLISAQTDKVKKAEEEVRQYLGSVRVDKSIVQKAADVLLSSSDNMILKLKDEINQLAERYNQSINLVQSSIGIYQAEKFLSESYKALKDSLNGNPEAKKARQTVFRQYGRLFGKNMVYYESVFEQGVNVVLEKLEEMAPVGKHMEGIIANSVKLAGELEVKKKLLDTSTSDRRLALQKQIEDQFNEIVNFEFVKSLDVDRNNLVVTTADATIKSDSKYYNIGGFTIKIGMTAPRTINIRNTKWGMKTKYQHPHITDGGRSVCWGSIRKGINQLKADWNWLLLVQVIWNFCNSYNPDDSYTTVTNLISGQGRTLAEATKRAPRRKSQPSEVL